MLVELLSDSHGLPFDLSFLEIPTLFDWSHIEYSTKSWCPYLRKNSLTIDQRSFRKHSFGISDLDRARLV